MIRLLNQFKPDWQAQGRAEGFQRAMPGSYGTDGAKARETGLNPVDIVPGVTKAEENGAKAVGKDGRRNRDSYECQTCKNRKYKDGSDDPGVSFKTATHLSPQKAASAVRAHEMEHVTREQAKARREDREVVSQSVTYKTGVCPECGTPYVAGGTTRTVTKGRKVQIYGLDDMVEKGKYFDQIA